MAVTLATSGMVKLKAGANRPTDDTVLTNSDYEQFINEAEALIHSQTLTDWVALYSTLDAHSQYLLNLATSSLAANSVVKYDLGAYGVQEAQTMLNVNYNDYKEAIRLLEDQKSKVFTKDQA